MAEGYCVKCKAKKDVVDAVETVMKNGRKAIKGKCPDCATIMFKILGAKEIVTSETLAAVEKPEAQPEQARDSGPPGEEEASEPKTGAGC